MSAPAYPWLDTVWEQFRVSKQQGRLGHAVLIVGPEGVGKRALAESVTRALLCRHDDQQQRPCGQCPACVQVEQGSHPDVHRVEADEKTGSIGIASVRDTCAQLLMTSQMAGYRIGLFPDIERCSVSAANSLLKTLEEPPPGVFMMLISSRPGRLPATIRSRCQLWRCASPHPTQAVPWLASQGVADPESALALAGGAPLRALKADVGEVLSELDATLQAVMTGQQSIARAARLLEPHGSEAVLAPLLGLIDRAITTGMTAGPSGLQFACFGVTRTARQLYAWRDTVLREIVRDSTGLNELATLERALAAGRQEAPAAVI